MKIQIVPCGEDPHTASLESSQGLNEFLRKLYREKSVWGLDYSTVPDHDFNRCLSIDIFWRLFRAFSLGSVVVIGESLYKVSNTQDKNEILDLISVVSGELDKLEQRYWFDEQNEGLVAVIFQHPPT